MNDIIVIEPMTREEARETIDRIKSHVEEMGRYLVALRDRQGWKALGYRNWTDCLEREFDNSRQHLYRLMNAHEVNENLSPWGYKVNTKQAEAIKNYPPEIQPAIVGTAQKRYGDKITPGKLKVVGDVIEELYLTGGHVDSGTGESGRVEVALNEAEKELQERQKQYMTNNSKYEKIVAFQEALIVAVDGDDKTIRLSGWDVTPGEIVRVSVFVLKQVEQEAA